VRQSVCWTAVLVALAISGRARAFEADEPTVTASLRYTASAPGCIEAKALKALVEERLARRVFTEASDTDLSVEVSEKQVSARNFRITLTLRSAEGLWLGARELDGPEGECSALDESLALVVAIAVDIPREELLARKRALATASAPAAPIAAAAPAAPRRLHVPEPASGVGRAAAAQRFELTLAAALAAAAGILPQVSPGVRLSLGVRPANFWRSELGASWWKSTEASDLDRGSGFELLTLDLSVCPWEPRPGSVRVSVCATQMLGRLRARGFGFDQNREQVGLTYAFGARLQAGFGLAGPLR
jgi:hypothetical protein